MNNSLVCKLILGLAFAVPVFLSAPLDSAAQTVVVKDTLMKTYPFADPDPVPNGGMLYPYWRFDGFTTGSEVREWKMVVLENDYLRVKVFPQIGGKIWSVFDKTSGKEMFYDNDAVKFRDISMRGPWTSGGIEFNYGVIGHAPSCSSDVDFKVETKSDGSVSCYIGVIEMLSRSHWTVEINLPKDAVWVRTSSIWHNDSAEYQPFYSWANSGVRTGDDLVLVYPSHNAVGHGGENLEYPKTKDGKDLSLYTSQAYGDDKSYHMVGSHKPFFGAYYTGEDRGVMHWSLRDEKLGRKYFSWAQSRRGLIWVNLLTDGRPQYIEMQSGKLYNQNQVKSSRTSAYRQPLFSPFGTEQWSDYWLPYSRIGPADNVTLDAVTSVRGEGERYCIGIYPLRRASGDLTVYNKEGKIVHTSGAGMLPARVVNIELNEEPSRICIGGRSIWEADEQILDRPQDRNSEFRPYSPEGQLIMARDYCGMRMYDKAEVKVDSALCGNPALLGALTLKAQLLYRRMQYAQAYEYSSKALAIDQYDPDAGYIGGLAALHLGKKADAMDRLEVAAIANSSLRGAAFTQLAKIYFRDSDAELAAHYARKALDCNGANLTALQILYKAVGKGMDKILELNPLSHFAAAEEFLAGELTAAQLAATFQEEIAWQDYLELALFYRELGLDKQALAILEALPRQNMLTALWAACLHADKSLMADAQKQEIDFVFPFRQESFAPLSWAVENGGGWQSRYLLAMLQNHLGNTKGAEALVKGVECDYAPFYAFRFELLHNESDLVKAVELDSDSWRYITALAAQMRKAGRAREAVSLLEPYYAAHPNQVRVGDALVEAYMQTKQYKKAEKIIDRIEILPFEGLRSSHEKYRRIKLNLAASAIDRGQFGKARKLLAQALEWPERLGVGKPYDYQIDTTVETWLLSLISERERGNAGTAGSAVALLEEKLR